MHWYSLGAGVGRRQQSHRRAACACLGLIAVFAVLASHAVRFAQAEPASEQVYQRYEVYSGVDVTSNSVFGYFGGVWALGRSVTGQGLRLKVLGGTGRYDYQTTLPGFTGKSTVQGDVELFQAMAGYQWQRGDWTVKSYLGLAAEEHDLKPNDPANSVAGSRAGVIGQLELWRNLGSTGFLSFDSSYSTTFESYFAQGRIGKRFSRRLSVGLEGAALGNEEYESGRGGAFMRFHMGQVDLTLSGGVGSDYYGDDTGGYGALGLYSRF